MTGIIRFGPLNTIVAVLGVLSMGVAACSGRSPADPSVAISATFATPVQAHLVICSTCTTDPREWIAADFPVTVTNSSNTPATLASVTVTVLNRTRGNVELGRNVRPNASHPYLDVRVPAQGSLTVQAGAVYFPPPAPGDDVVVEVAVALDDGRVAARTGPIVAVP